MMLSGRVKTYMRRSSRARTSLSRAFRSPSKVLLKELQSLGLDVSVLRDDGTEVEIGENVDYGETDLRHIIEGETATTVTSPLATTAISSRSSRGWRMVEVGPEATMTAAMISKGI